MKPILLSILILFITGKSFSQSLSGQWKGDFDSNTGNIVQGGDNSTEYILEINIEGKKITGFSYSYFNNRQYFVICQLVGTYDKSSKTIDVVEIARIKGITPPDWNDCLQEHLLMYKKEGTTEVLTGIWKAAKNQSGGCGSGYTTLIRNTIPKELNTYNKPTTKTTAPKVKTTVKTPPPTDVAPAQQAAPQNNTRDNTIDTAAKKFPEEAPPVAADTLQKKAPDLGPTPAEMNYEKRTNQVLQTIAIEGTTFTVDLYDNGAIDGDSISLFYNNRVIVSHKRLSDRAISITLTINLDQEINELTMYAENLGEIPPNTALMVINDGKHRYEVNVSSDLTTSGSIHFVHAQPAIPVVPLPGQ